jgi:putative oxidoreductase
MAQTYSDAATHTTVPTLTVTPADRAAITRSLFMLGRAIFGGFFLFSGIQHFTRAAEMAPYAASKGVPFPELAVLGTGALLLAGSVSLLLGVLPRVGAACIALFLIGVTPSMHAFWNESGQQAVMEMGNFMKNMALLGAAFMVAAIPGPWPGRLFHRH